MKKPLAIMLMILLIVSIGMLFLITACKDSSKKRIAFNYFVKSATEEKEDGWVYFFNYEYTLDNNGQLEKAYYNFGGDNLKHKHIEGLDIPIIDEQTGRIIDYATSSFPYLLLNQDIKPDLLEIQRFFFMKQFVVPIEMADLEELVLKTINKEEVLELFNEAIGKDRLTQGNYAHIPGADIKQEEILSGYQWQVGYFISYGNIVHIRIELIYDETNYISDLVEKNEANESQFEIYENIINIEKDIIENQSFISGIEGYKDLSIGNIRFERLFNLLEDLESRGLNVD
ncbi:MAG: hypothetical protein PHG06_20345 [Parabacteroides sp.]|nr:hypothetical protein [Parabacteroides sp.]